MTEKEKLEKREHAKKSLQILTDIEESVKTEYTIKDNKVEFKSGDKVYRVRKPDFPERNEIQQIRRKKYLELIKDDEMLFRKQWVELYKKKNIDINKMEDDIKRKQSEIEALLVRLVKITDPASVVTLKSDILKLRSGQFDLTIEKTDLLQYSIEDQLLLHDNTYTTYLVLERKESDKWVRHFDSFKDFEKCVDSDLMAKAFEYMSVLIYGENYESKSPKKTS